MGVSRHRRKPKMHILFKKGCFWKGPLKGFLLSVIHKSIFFSRTQLLQRIGCKLQKNYQKLWIMFQHARWCSKTFLSLVFCFVLVSVFCFFGGGKRGHLPAIFEFFLFPQKSFLQSFFHLLVFLLFLSLFSSISKFHLCFSPF